MISYCTVSSFHKENTPKGIYGFDVKLEIFSIVSYTANVNLEAILFKCLKRHRRSFAIYRSTCKSILFVRICITRSSFC